MNQYDVAVIGAGPGGYPAAIRAAQLGKKVVIIEKEAPGGTCLNHGCIPTKALIASAELFENIKRAGVYGVTATATYDFAKMAARKDEVVSKLSQGVSQLLAANKVEFIHGIARFESPTRLTVKTPDGAVRWLTAVKTIIASGSKSAMPSFIPRHERILESRAFLGLTELPKSLIILGGGVIGCEFACLAAALGVDVTVCEMLDDILPMVDKEIRRTLRANMERLGVAFRVGAPLSDIVADGSSVGGRFREESIRADMMLVAIGRTVDTAKLNLEAANVKTDSRGQIIVDDQCRTSAPNLFAVGDVVSGSQQLAHVATSQGVLAAEVIASSKRKREAVIPSCIFTMPEIGIVGLSETEAKARNIDVKTGTFSFASLGKALAAGVADGMVKWIIDPATDRLLGAQAVGAHATELIATAAVAIRNELTATEFGNTVHAHPTLSEAWMEAAHAAHSSCIHAVNRRR